MPVASLSGKSTSVAVADFNGDGLKDAAWPLYVDKVDVGLGFPLPATRAPFTSMAWAPGGSSKASTVFLAPSTLYSRANATTPAMDGDVIAVADLDLDGVADVVSLSSTTGALTWLRGNATAAPGFVLYTPSDLLHGITEFVLADVDGDGDVDVSVAGAAGIVGWFNNTAAQTKAGGGVVSPGTLFGVGSSMVVVFNTPGSTPASLSTARISSAGPAVDVVFAAYNGVNWAVWLATSLGTYPCV